MGDVSGADLVAAEEAFLGAHVRALTLSLARKDEYTEEHTRRVALRAVQVGEELGLTGSRLRALATGALVHDIGKLSVPDSILQKPGPLTDEEFDVIKEHPQWGDRLLVDLGFGDEVRHLVRDHHERLDGSGYPHGAEGSLISFDARILAVCDVYDALISTPCLPRSVDARACGRACSARRAASRSTRNASQRSSASSRATERPPRRCQRGSIGRTEEGHMGLKEFWNRLTGGDKVERVEEELEEDGAEQPEPVEDYEGMKDDVARESVSEARLDSDR